MQHIRFSAKGHGHSYSTVVASKMGAAVALGERFGECNKEPAKSLNFHLPNFTCFSLETPTVSVSYRLERERSVI